MTSGLAIAKEPQVSVHSGFLLREHERHLLVCAIESAIEVTNRGQFDSWMRGPFRALLPHENVVYMKLDEQGTASELTCLHHTLVDAETTEFLGHPEHGLAVRLARDYRGNRRQCSTVEAEALHALLDVHGGAAERSHLHNAVVHRVKFLSGATYGVVLVNVPASRFNRCRHLLKLLSSHLKMALSRTIAGQEQRPVAPLTARELEILRWMGAGKSNREISAILDISALTLKNHVTRLYRKLHVQSREEAVARGLVALGDT